MSGYGEARGQQSPLAVSVELRTINAKHFKIHTRIAERYGLLEPKIEALLRGRIHRGTVQVNVRLDREHTADDYRINIQAISAYCEQLKTLREQLPAAPEVSLDALLALPGVVDEQEVGAAEIEKDWPLIEKTLREAIDRLDEMRAGEGQAMAADLATNCDAIAGELQAIESRVPSVAESYRERLRKRVQAVLDQHGVTLTPADIIREVSIYAERCDISEEIVRLRSHLQQFTQTLQSEESSGRKLEWLTQEMFREANTIGSKAGDAEISRHTIEIKAAIERVREMVQNVQ